MHSNAAANVDHSKPVATNGSRSGEADSQGADNNPASREGSQGEEDSPTGAHKNLVRATAPISRDPTNNAGCATIAYQSTLQLPKVITYHVHHC